VQSSNDNNEVTSRTLKPWEKALAWASIALLVVIAALAIPYYRLARRVDRQLAGSALNTVDYYSAPEIVSTGDPIAPADLADAVKRAAQPVEINLANGKITSIVDAATHRSLSNYQLKPRLLTNMSEEGRAKRMPVYFSDIPPTLVRAILSAEDKRFFRHSGLDTLRIAKAIYVDLRERRKEQGASTITMQLARNLCLRRDKSWKRKMEEALIALHLEHKFSKNQIFERYCNLVYLGGQRAFGINGIGEAAQAYFNKDVRKLNLPEAATIAGLIQRPIYLNPFRYPARALDRRNFVLKQMLGNNYITGQQYAEATAATLSVNVGATELSESQYFVDAAGKEAARKSDEQPDKPAAVYTTLDLRLQRAAERAIADGMQLVDKQLASHRGSSPSIRPQVALIALDPHTGEIKALCGGRDYATSQLDRVFAKRPPGSVFKPFVYTAALNTAITGGDPVLTPASLVDDSPTTFENGDQTYNPANFKHEFMGQVTLRQAMAHSLNVATVKVAQTTGYQNVVAIAQRAGMNEDIQPTPAVALGAYQVTPFEIARAYTIFANGGSLVQPAFVAEIRDSGGRTLYRQAPRTKPVLDPRIAFLMVDMLQEVMRSGTAAGVRARGFRLPAAGKTGTSHDGWFAGFTSGLLCVVWVGFDDYTDLGLEGARSALPIWTEFMSEAVRYKQYGDAKPFMPPPGVTQVSVDPKTGELSGPGCPAGISSYFIDGTQPQTPCMPQEVEIISTPDGGVIERSMPAQIRPADAVGSLPAGSTTVEIPSQSQAPSPMPVTGPPR
jgi:penicillin-binding protein 1B